MKSDSQAFWDQRATVRSRPRRLLTDTAGDFFPKTRQPLCFHPKVMALGEEAIRYTLIQSAYKFMWDIAEIETRVVNEVAEKISRDAYPFAFDNEVQLKALNVLVDESYHAYVARDFMQQLENLAEIKPLSAIHEAVGIFAAINTVVSELDEATAELFRLVAVCIAENSITSELIELNKEKDPALNNIFYLVNKDHMVDEARHAYIFQEILSYAWKKFTEQQKQTIGALLPSFILQYLSFEYQKNFNIAILKHLQLPRDAIDQIISETNVDMVAAHNFHANPALQNVIKLLQKCHVLQHEPTYKAFVNSELAKAL